MKINLAVASTKAENKVEGRLLLDVVVLVDEKRVNMVNMVVKAVERP